MAKGNAISGNITGKKGSSIFYKVSNSNNKVTQGLREYQPVVTNPKTTSQAQQRMKLQPATNFYRGLSDVLDHSFEGQKYGGRNHSYFMKLAIGNADGINYPYLYKGDTNFVPGSYLVSRGSLGRVKVNFIEKNRAEGYYNCNLNYEFFDDGTYSFENWVNESIKLSPKFQKGDQITGIFCFRNAAGRYYPVVRRLVLDPAKYEGENAYKVMANAGLYITSGRLSPCKSEMDENGNPLPLTNDTMVAAAVILSRPTRSAGGQVTWRRSISRMYLTPEFRALFQNEQLYKDALASYLKAEVDANSEWYLNQGAIMQAAIDAVPAGAKVVVYHCPAITTRNIVSNISSGTTECYVIAVPGLLAPNIVGTVATLDPSESIYEATDLRIINNPFDSNSKRFTNGELSRIPMGTGSSHLPAYQTLKANYINSDTANRLLDNAEFDGEVVEWTGSALPK